MIVHIYYKDNSQEDVETTRVTVFTPGSEPSWLDCSFSPCLLMGTILDYQVISMAKISWYWIEEN